MKARYETRRAPMGDMAWRARAACQYRDPGPWFSGVRVEIAKAREVCMGCPVRSACLCSQLEYEELIGQVDDGMFGGRTPRERKVLLRHRESIAPPRMGRPQVAALLATGEGV